MYKNLCFTFSPCLSMRCKFLYGMPGYNTLLHTMHIALVKNIANQVNIFTLLFPYLEESFNLDI